MSLSEGAKGVRNDVVKILDKVKMDPITLEIRVSDIFSIKELFSFTVLFTLTFSKIQGSEVKLIISKNKYILSITLSVFQTTCIHQ